MRRYRSLSIVVSAIAVSALVGGFFGRSLLATDDKVPEHYKAFTAALSAIESGYIDKIDSDRLVYGAVRGMLSTLDPHSSFFDPREYAQMRERQEGHYYGIGIQISAVDGDIIAQFVFEGSPAHKQGVRQGDVIANIAGEGTKGWNTDQAMRKLRGARGTPVQISLRRRGYAEVINVELVRDEITIPTVPAFFMIDATTGYVQLRDFGENTDRDLKRALQALAPKGMRRLLLDIRNNPGGPLDQAIKVVNEFMPRGKMIVYTRGRVSNSDQDYRATEDGQFTDIPIVVMANRSSASASEIVTGALQDHDRAYVVGETTFGKALVQSIYRISGGAGLALTTAHYYTPSGRLIQRPWDTSFDEYLTYTMRDQDANKAHSPSDLKHTDAGRPVYSGGGIEPDKRVAGPLEGFDPTRFGRGLNARGSFAALRGEVHRRGRHARHPAVDRPPDGQAGLRRGRRDGRRLPRTAQDRSRPDRRGRVQEGSGLHQGHDPVRNRPRAVWRLRGAPAPDRGRSAGARGAHDVWRGSAAVRPGEGAGQGRALEGVARAGWGK